ncbi:MAG: hypothetical protein AAF355_00080 [Myxococcota bacterium]
MPDLEDLLAALAGNVAEEQGEHPPEQESPFAKALSMSLSVCLEEMCTREIVEVDEGNQAALVAELVTSACDAHNPKHMYKKLARTLLDSEHVEEVYASDDELLRTFARFLEQPSS